MAEEKDNQELIAFLRQKFGQTIKASGSTIVFPIRRIGRVSGRLLPATSIYEVGEPGSTAYLIDGLSQHGMLSLIDIPALTREDVDIYRKDMGTYERDTQGAMNTIYLTQYAPMGQVFFGQDTLDAMIAQRIIFVTKD